MSNKSTGTATRLGSAFQFLEGFLREPLTVGALWPSSAALAQAVTTSCAFGPADTVVELGAGTGAFTQGLLTRLDGPGRLLAFDVNAASVRLLRERFPACRVIHDSAEHLNRHLQGQKARCVVSGLAWGNMLPAAQDRIMQAIVAGLAPDGQFVAFAYTHARYYPTTLRFRKLMFRAFSQVETTPIIWRNFPPAYVYRCRR